MTPAGHRHEAHRHVLREGETEAPTGFQNAFERAKVRIPLEDDAVVTERGVEWLYPPIDRILLIR